MSKYDFDLDIYMPNSLSIIINMVEDGKRVLEFGPAHGRLTKYLNEQKDCVIDIVELDVHSGKEAAKFAKNALVGKEDGNIEDYKWESILKDERYDYIIFADVLEHLYDPWSVLKRSRALLKEDGSVIISIPNIAHNAIIISLLKDEFNYTNVGLLDNTHIRFFTYKTLKGMIDKAGLVCVQEKANYAQVGQIEVLADYAEVSPEVSRSLKNRYKGNVYQYVFETKKREHFQECQPEVYLNLDARFSDEAVFFIKQEEDNIFSEEKCIRKKIFGTEQNIKICLKSFPKIKELRFDPLNAKCIIKIKDMEAVLENGTVHKLGIRYTTAVTSSEMTYLFLDDDPQIYIELKEKNYISLNIKYEVLYIDGEFLSNVSGFFMEIVKERDQKILFQDQVISDKESDIIKYERELDNSSQIIDSYETKMNEINKQNIDFQDKLIDYTNKVKMIEDLEEEVKSLKRTIEKLESNKENICVVLEQRETQLKEIYSSRGWKLLTKIKRLVGK